VRGLATHLVNDELDAVALEDGQVFYAPRLGAWFTAWALEKFGSTVTEIPKRYQYFVDVPDEIVDEAHAVVERVHRQYPDV
jgi:hypothetical protein